MFFSPLLLFIHRSEFLPTRASRHLKYRGLASAKKGAFRVPNLEKELGWEQDVNPELVKE